MAKRLSKIVWAVDAFAEDTELQDRIVKVLALLNQTVQATIEPVYVLSPDQLRVSADVFPGKVGDFRLSAEKRLDSWLKKSKLKHTAKPTILVSSDMSLRSAVHALVEYAKKNNANLIAASTLARKGVTRFLLGSFAETLILQSDIPIFLVSPKTKITKRFSQILFPTDFTEKSKWALEEAAELAREIKARIVLFHQMEYINPYTAAPFGAMPIYQNYLADDLKRRTETGEQWVSELTQKGLQAELVLSKKGTYAVDAIIKQSQKMPSTIIAMASQTGPVASALLGSVTRQVLRVACCPVWVIHPPTEKIAHTRTVTEALEKGAIIV